ncbi:hypothetical protein M422DRAFT_259523 [Sphaerobolus stellatus SS14]|uniref:AB hydrolase-1 domain-containing protein n=1 Tax=Sphaerobolus stellatus (strain SS14) TaxID=990650 RepID=A0A0C9USW0_SPHS4|nr:hypothetical protein M422DRAFT_259523 [Sphaerobolus stellatus SS14]
MAELPIVEYNTLRVDGVDVFYRSAGVSSAPVLLLLHGFPASSFQFRNLIPLLARKYRIVAPDLPGFGFTVVPEERNYDYIFDNLAKTTQAFVDSLGLKQLRSATSKPEQITAIITQNGNAYEEGLVPAFWEHIKIYWKASPKFDPTLSSQEARSMLSALTEPVTKYQYTEGVPEGLLSRIDPAAYALDSFLLARQGQDAIQLSLFYDYQTNVAQYPTWQQYFRTKSPRVLALWGKNDPAFGPAGAEGYKKDLKDVEVVLVDTGHFALETHVELYAAKIDGFSEEVLSGGKTGTP